MSTSPKDTPSKKDYMYAIAGGPEDADCTLYSGLIAALEGDANFARELGALARYAQASTEAAYPGQVRREQDGYTPAEWAKAGYPHRAKALKLLKLERS